MNIFTSKPFSPKGFTTALSGIRRFDATVQRAIEHAVTQACAYNLTDLYRLLDALPKSARSKKIIAYIDGLTAGAINFDAREVTTGIDINLDFYERYPTWIMYNPEPVEPRRYKVAQLAKYLESKINSDNSSEAVIKLCSKFMGVILEDKPKSKPKSKAK